MEENNYPYQLPFYWSVCTKYDGRLKSFRPQPEDVNKYLSL